MNFRAKIFIEWDFFQFLYTVHVAANSVYVGQNWLLRTFQQRTYESWGGYCIKTKYVLWCRIHIYNTKQKHFKSVTNPAIIQIKAYNLVCKLRSFLGRVFDTFYLARSWPTMTMTIRQYFCLPKFPDCFRWCHQKRSVIYSPLSYSFLAQRTAQFDATSLLWKLCSVLPTKNGGHCTITSLSFPMQQLFIRPQ